MTLVMYPTGSVFAEIEDGTYKVEYEMKEASSENTSIADGYFTSPAMLTVEDGVQFIQITVTGADMIKSLNTPNGPVEVLDEDEENDERTVQFEVEGDLSDPLEMEMHVVVPDLYDMEHTARAVFDVSDLEKAESLSENDDSENENVVAEGEDNPQTGDQTPIPVYVTLLLGSIAIFTIYRLRVTKG